MTKHDEQWNIEFSTYVGEFKNESDRAAVILGAAKLDSQLGQILDRLLLPATSGSDELLEGDSPLSTFSARINACYRMGAITADFAKSLHLVRRIRNSFAHEVVGVSLQSGSHADRLRSLLTPLRPLPFFSHFRGLFFGPECASNDFRACLALMTARLQGVLTGIKPLQSNPNGVFILHTWSEAERIPKEETKKPEVNVSAPPKPSVKKASAGKPGRASNVKRQT